MKLFTLVFGFVLFISYGEFKEKYETFDIKDAEAILKRYNQVVKALKEESKVQGGSFSLNPKKPKKSIDIPEKCKGKDTCHDFRICKLCLPYWRKFNKLNSDVVKEEEHNDDEDKGVDKVGLDAEDPGYEEAYEVATESVESSGYDW